MDEKNNGNRGYFGIEDSDFYIEMEEETVDMNEYQSKFGPVEADINFDENIQKAPKSYSLGPINLGSGASKPADAVHKIDAEETSNQPKKKFVVTFDDSEDISPAQESAGKNPVRRGSIYFANGKQNVPERKSSTQPKQNVKPQKPAKADTPSKKVQQKKKAKAPATRGSFALRFLASVLACTLFISAIGISCVNDILAIRRNDESVVVTIPTDCTPDDIIDILSENKLIHQKWFCKFFFNLKNKLFKDDPNELEFLSGVYYVQKNLGFEAYLSTFQEVQQTEKTVNVFFQEGWTTYQMFDKLENFGICKKVELVAALQGAEYDFDFIKSIPEGSDRVFRLEGYLFPDTYEFYEKCDANSIIRKMLTNFGNKWSDEYAKRAEELGMTMDEVIILASIIQREAGNKEQMKLVSSVLHNRLNHSNSYPTLGCDATLNYIETYVKPNITNVQAQVYADAYNTSRIKGLPAGAVCNPGLDAIEAALYPDDTDYYYFCHDNSGKIYLASSNAQHDRNLLEVLRVNNG